MSRKEPERTSASHATGRQTGSAEWVAQRGEDGAGGVGARAQAPPTRFRAAKDAALAMSADKGARLCGGYARASGENAPAETASQVCRAAYSQNADGMLLCYT